jgi:tripartite ATP-independent transporter DctM subunit
MNLIILLPFGLFFVLSAIRVPISIAMMVSAVAYFLASGQDVGMLVDTVPYNLYTSYVTIAIPLFVFTANVMTNGQIADRLFTFASTLVARYRGGLAHVNVVNSLIFSGMSGSAVADAAGVGKMEIEHMKKAGFEGGFSCAVTATSSTLGPIFPPSIPMVIYAMLSGASVGALFLGGIIPGILVVIVQMIYIVYISRKRNYPKGEKFTLREFLKYTVISFPALLIPVILLGGIYGGVATPTEAGALASLYALIIAILVYRTLGWRALLQTLKDTVSTTGNIGLLIGAAYAFSFIVAAENIPQYLSEFLLGITDNKYVFLLLINVIFLLLGMIIDTSVIMLVFIPIIVPLITALDINLVHFGVIIVLNMMIGLITPPLGLLLFITSASTKTPLKDVIRETLPMVHVLITVLFLVTYIPDLVLFLPRMLGY